MAGILLAMMQIRHWSGGIPTSCITMRFLEHQCYEAQGDIF